MGAESRPDRRQVSVAALEQLVSGTFRALGAPAGDAAVVARRMIEADLHGTHSHGVFRLPHYVDLIRGGGFNLTPLVRTTREMPASALVDGDDALGHVSMTYATDLAIDKARESGAAWVGLFNGNHAGALSVYARRIVAAGLAGVVMAVGQGNVMAPWGGTEPLLSSNPIAFGVPGGDGPGVVFDMATTVVAAGQVKRHAADCRPLPEGWLIDREGRPVTDPSKLEDSLLLPVGGHKGYGLSLMIGLLAGVLNGASFGRDTLELARVGERVSNTGHTVIAVDPGSLRDPCDFEVEVARHLRDIVGSAPIEPSSPVRLPGQRHAVDEAEGVWLDDDVISGLESVSRLLGTALPDGW